MKRFPTVYELANASEDEVNAHWAGLGFYRRARMLRSGANYVVDELDGVVPDTVEDLMKIDGIGRYDVEAFDINKRNEHERDFCIGSGYVPRHCCTKT